MKKRLIVGDDHPMVCQGLQEIIGRSSDLEVVGIAHDGGDVERMARTLAADLLILDIALPTQSGIKILESLRATGVNLPVLIFTMYPANQYAAYVRRAGAQGFIGKDSDEKSLLAGIRKILAGGVCFRPTPLLVRGSNSGVADASILSKRENQVLGYLLRGTPLVTIAQELDINARSVTTYRRRLLDKLAVKNNAELISLMSRCD